MPLLAGTDDMMEFFRIDEPIVSIGQYISNVAYSTRGYEVLRPELTRVATAAALSLINRGLYLVGVGRIQFYQPNPLNINIRVDLQVRSFKDNLTIDEMYYWGDSFRERLAYEISDQIGILPRLVPPLRVPEFRKEEINMRMGPMLIPHQPVEREWVVRKKDKVGS